jgi:flagellar hook-associated protein 1 FlgK
MGVNFSPLEIGRRALQASQLGLAVTGQNIANVNTPGYSRQKVMLSASPGNDPIFSPVGTGVTIDGVRSFRDQFVESRLQTESAITGRLTAQSDALSPVDGVFNDTNGAGISAAMNAFFGSFTALEANPVSLPLRTDTISKAGALGNAMSGARSQLTSIRTDNDNQLRDVVNQVNGLSQQVADLNVRISVAVSSGGSASELTDQRDQLVQQIAGLTGARSTDTADGMVTLTLQDGQALVSGNQANTLQTQSTPPDGLATVLLNGQTAAISDGQIKGLQDAIGAISGQITSLDDLASAIATRVNAVHSSGTDAYGNPGGNFFNVPASGPITAANLTVAPAIVADPKLIVASPLAPPSASATVAGAIGALLTDPTSVVGTRTGSFSSIYGSIVADAGSSLKSAQDDLSTQKAILDQATAQRDSIAGVSLDEEAVNMLQYQRSYEAAARFLKIADELTQTIISLGQ